MRKIIILFVLLPFFAIPQTHTLVSKEHIDAPVNHILKPGQLSKDGKRLYIPMTNDTLGKSYVFVYNISGSGKYKLTTKIDLAELPEGAYFSGQVSFSEDEREMVGVGSLNDRWENNEMFMFTRESEKLPLWDVRILGELNEFGEAESYPWLSGDGLRLYYCFKNQIYFAKRKEGDRSFKFPVPLELSFEGDILSCYLSSDELKLYFVNRDGLIYLATRDNKKEDFSAPILYSDDLVSENFISSFSIDDKEKIVTVYYSGNKFNEPGSEVTAHMLIYRVQEMR